jgi:hypothetical protein
MRLRPSKPSLGIAQAFPVAIGAFQRTLKARGSTKYYFGTRRHCGAQILNGGGQLLHPQRWILHAVSHEAVCFSRMNGLVLRVHQHEDAEIR